MCPIHYISFKFGFGRFEGFEHWVESHRLTSSSRVTEGCFVAFEVSRVIFRLG